MGDAYTRAHVARICKMSPRRLRNWERAALVAPSAQREGRRAFAFRDLVSVRSLRLLEEQGVSLRQIRLCVESVRRRIPELERPVDTLRLWMKGSPRVVVQHAGGLFEPDGQAVLDLAPADDASVAPLAPRPLGDREQLEAAFAWFERGCALDAEPAHYEEAAEAYLRALDLDPGFADAHCNLGAVRFNQDRRAEARACFERALELDPEHPEAHLNLATLLEEEGRNPAALSHYRAAVEADPTCADAHVSLALLYERLGARPRARRHWASYLSLDPGGGWAELARRRLSPRRRPRPDRSG